MIEKKQRITIGIPCYDRPTAETFEDYMRFAYYLGRRYPEYDFFLAIKTKSEQFRARNSIVQAAYQTASDFLLFLDDDHVIDWHGVNYPSEKYEFLHTLLSHMKDDPNLGIVGALYWHRGGQCRPVLLKKLPGGDYGYLRDDELLGQLQPVDVQGGGCMLIRMKSLDFCEQPWFVPETEFGTDFQICRKMAAVGFGVACDTSIEIGHVANERKIITSRNRHESQVDSGTLSEDLALKQRLGNLYEEYQADIMEYLGVDLKGLSDLQKEYKSHNREFVNHDDPKDYYRAAGRPYLAHAAFFAPQHFDDFVLRTVRTEIPGQGIDFGCGAGRVSFQLAKSGHRIYFKDIDGVETYEFLKWRCNKAGLNGLAVFDEWPIAETCDYVLCLDSLEHLVNWREILARLANCLKPSGCMITNFLQCQHYKNPEHIFMDKAEFLAEAKRLNLYPINAAVLQKLPGVPV